MQAPRPARATLSPATVTLQDVRAHAYTAAQAAALLGCSVEAIEENAGDLGAFRAGGRLLVPRTRLHALLWEDLDASGTDGRAPGEPSVLDRVLRVLPLLEREERISLARAALSLEAS